MNSPEDHDTFDGFLSHFLGTVNCRYCCPGKYLVLLFCLNKLFVPLFVPPPKKKKDIRRNFVPISYTYMIILQFLQLEEEWREFVIQLFTPHIFKLFFFIPLLIFDIMYRVLIQNSVGNFCTLFDSVFFLIDIFKLDKAHKTFLSDTIVFEWYLFKPTIFFFLVSNELNK